MISPVAHLSLFDDSRNESKKSSEYSASRLRRSLSWFFEFLFLGAPLIILTISLVMQHLYHGPITTYINSFRINHEGADASGLYYSLDADVTYYNRQCTAEDITTKNLENKTDRSNLLVLTNDVTPKKAQEVMMTHGAVILPNVLSDETASQLRTYLESRHHIQDELGWQEKFWEDISRLSLGLGFHDDPSIPQALHEIGTNPAIRSTLEGIFGTPDAAVVETSTLTCLFGAPNQGLHTDSDYFGSSLMYSRTFLHSYTMFIALQDTTSRMGATTVCPGTHWCANEDMLEFCQAHTEDDDDDEIEDYDLNEAFDVSSNGVTGKRAGVLRKGDAMMFNQNVFHRGPQNDDPINKNTNRVMFIVTFVNQRDFDKFGDVRQQGMGTYYYQRWNMWGHLYSDFQYALSKTSNVWKEPWAVLKALGVLTRNEAVPWTEHWARQFANQMDFYDPSELPDFKAYLENEMPAAIQKVFKHFHEGTSNYDWHEYVPQVLKNMVESAKFLYIVGILMSTLLGLVLQKNHYFFRALLWHTWFVTLGYGLFYTIATHSFLGKQIHSLEIHATAFPKHGELPSHTTLPDRIDFLIGTRFDAEFLGSFNHVLDYHPGNIRLQKIIGNIATDVELPLDIIVSSIMDEWQHNQSASPRMLLQDQATGYWTALSTPDTIGAMKKMVVKLKNPLLDKLDTVLLQMLADARFGRQRNTIMSTVYGAQLLLDWQQNLFSDLVALDGYSTNPISQSTSAVLPVVRRFSPVPKKYIVLNSSQKTLPRVDPPAGTLFVGSRVWAATIADGEGRWESAKILTLDDGLIRVEYTRDGVSERTLSLSLVIPFSHMVQGDSVQILIEGTNTAEWHNGIIQSSSPLGVYAVELDDGSIIERVQSTNIRSASSATTQLGHGQKVWAQIIGEDHLYSNGFWVLATIVDFSKNDEDKWADVEYEGTTTTQRLSLSDVQPYFSVQVGDTVDLLLDDDYIWWEAEVLSVNLDESGNLLYNAYVGERDLNVDELEEQYLRPLPPLVPPATRVLANYHGHGEWFPGTIRKVHAESRTYHVVYDDGDYEDFVWRDRIRIVWS
jgi:ectoine hydroxylase-related dioxygenase (phytanoyl-CoA dioxygenase family)